MEISNTHVHVRPLLILILIYFPFSAGNIMAFVALHYSSKRASSSNVYLRALAIGDLLTLLFSIIPSFLHFTIRPIFPSRSPILVYFFDRWGPCLVIVYVAYATRAFATYIIVFFSVERCATVLWPFKASSWFSAKTARRNVLIGFLIAYTWTLPGLFSKSKLPGRGSDPPRCRANKILFMFLKMQLYSSNLIPLIIVVLCNSLIVVILRRRTQELKASTATNQNAVLSSNEGQEVSANQNEPLSPNPNASLAASQKVILAQERRVTRRLLIVSTAYVLLLLPVVIVNVTRSVDELSGAYRTRNMAWANAIAISLTFMVGNYSINFALYCLTWRHFRRATYAILTCNRQQLQYLSTHHGNAPRHHANARQEGQRLEISPANSSSTKSTLLTSRGKSEVVRNLVRNQDLS